jgi:hypothetical protein
MPDELTIYSTVTDPVPGEIIAELSQPATCTPRTDEDGGQWYDLAWPTLAIKIRHFYFEEDDFAEHIGGFLGYVMHMAEGNMDPRLWEIYYHVSKVRNGLGLTIEPEYDDQYAPPLVGTLADLVAGFVLSGDRLLDPHGRLILGPGNERGDGVLHVFDSARERRERSGGRLATLGLATPNSLPTTVADEEGLMVAPNRVAQRAVVLLALAMRAEGVAQPKVVKFLQQRGVTKSVSPKEREFLQQANPDPVESQRLTWRYEALWVLLWALGHVDQLGPPASQCDARQAIRIVNEMPAERLVGQAELRAESEILDELDFYYRAHWHTVNARQADQPPPEGLDPDVIYERHYALNWLTSYMYQEWDDVTTDT